MNANRFSLVRSQQGFTLVELLLAITIFAILVTTGWMAINQLIQSKSRLDHHVEDLTHLQDAYSFMVKDFNQALPMTDMAQQTLQPAMMLTPVSVNFLRPPVEVQGLVLDSALSRVEYRLLDDTLWRSRYQTNRLINDQSLIDRSPILTNIQKLTFEAYNPEISTVWPTPQIAQYSGNTTLPMDTRRKAASILPRAVLVKIEQNGLVYNWVLPVRDTGPGQDELLRSLGNTVSENPANPVPGNTQPGVPGAAPAASPQIELSGAEGRR